MIEMKKLLMAAVAASVFALGATETENNEFRIMRAPGAVTVARAVPQSMKRT